MTLPLPLCPWVSVQFWKPGLTADASVPNAGGFIATYVAGSTTDQITYQNASSPLTAHANPIELDDQGRPPSSQIFLLPAGYTFEERDSDGNVLRTYDYVADTAYTFMNSFGAVQAEGNTVTSSPYTALETDNLIIVDSADSPFIVQLPPAADRAFPLVIKNVSAVPVRITPDGAETLEGANTYYVLPAVSGAINATVTLISDQTSAWWATGGIGL